MIGDGVEDVDMGLIVKGQAESGFYPKCKGKP